MMVLMMILNVSLPQAVLLVIRVWAMPTIGVWLAAALILYQCRVLERRRGSASFLV